MQGNEARTASRLLAMDVQIRPLAEGELDAMMLANLASFGEEVVPERLEIARRAYELDRILVAADAGEIVSGVAAASFQMTVPGGIAIPCAGVTAVGTLPTHRRRGIARDLLVRQLGDIRERGESIAALWASEAAIYQRFGYGIASYACAFSIKTLRSVFVRDLPVGGRVRLAERDAALKVIPDVYDRVRPTRPGMPDRPAPWLESRFWDGPQNREGAGPLFFAIHEGADGPDGYVAYRVKEHWSLSGGPESELHIEELMAATDEAYATLWRYCLDVDLIATVEGWKRPPDEPLVAMLAEPRALGLQIRDGAWIRLVDVEAALAARRYSHEGRLVVRVHDPTTDWNDGTFEVEGGPDGATCRRTDGEADLEMQADDLASAYLGTLSFRRMASAGRVRELRPGMLTTADALFSSAVAPWTPWIF